MSGPAPHGGSVNRPSKESSGWFSSHATPSPRCSPSGNVTTSIAIASPDRGPPASSVPAPMPFERVGGCSQRVVQEPSSCHCEKDVGPLMTDLVTDELTDRGQ